MDPKSSSSIRCLEFYSGMGGMHCALNSACQQTKALTGKTLIPEVVQAFDINTTANQVYELNFKKKVSPKTILALTVEIFEKYNAFDLWLMSPPCQPYTRQGKQKDTDDPRASSFLHLLTVIPNMKQKPKRILIENVVGFETSETRAKLIEMLQSNQYHFQEFHLSPNQIGIPNSRMRYFCLASLISKPISTLIQNPAKMTTCIPGSRFFDQEGNSTCSPAPISDYLEDTNFTESEKIAHYERFKVPESVLLKSGMSFDLVLAGSRRSCCFTKNYGRLVEGAGSVLQTASEDIKATSDPESLKSLKLRYFSPNEILKLHGFPGDFSFGNIADKKAYSLLGNGLNVSLVSELLHYMLNNWSDVDREEGEE